MKRGILSAVTLVAAASALYIVLFQGFGFPRIPPLLNYFLRTVAAMCAEIFVICNFKRRWIRLVPLGITALFALWGGYLFVSAESWTQVGFMEYVGGFCTPMLGCCGAWLLCHNFGGGVIE